MRKLQQIGNTILVSLPRDWIESNLLKKGSEVELNVTTGNLSITSPNSRAAPKEVVISYPLPAQENIVAEITGAYLLGYDIIKIKGKNTISSKDREKIRNSMRRLVGMEILEEDSSNVNVHFLLDATTLSPNQILKRMSTIMGGMFDDTIQALVSGDKSMLQTISDRDDEIDRQYFLLVRLIRSTMVDNKLASALNLQTIDILDYRIAANLIESAGDMIVELASSNEEFGINDKENKRIRKLADEIEEIHKRSIDAFIENDRSKAIDAIKLHRQFQNNMSASKFHIEPKKQVPIGMLDLLHTLENIERRWADVADLVKPVYSFD